MTSVSYYFTIYVLQVTITNILRISTEWLTRIPPAMYEEIIQHLKDMLACGAVRH